MITAVLALFPRYRAQTFSVGAVCQQLTADKEPEKVNMTRYKSRAQFPTQVLKIDEKGTVRTRLTNFVWLRQKSRQILSSPKFQFGNT